MFDRRLKDWTVERCLGIVLPMLFAVLSIVKLFYNHPGWADEFCLSDKAINVALYGDHLSTYWPETQVGIFYRMLALWLKVFGVSHVSVCSLEVLFAMLTCMMITHIAMRREIFTGWIQVLAFNLFFFGCANFVWTMLNGRYDMVVFFFSVLFCEALTRDSKTSLGYLCYLAICMFILKFIGTYSIPLLGFLGLWLLLFPQGNVTRRQMVLRGLVCTGALMLAIVTILILQFSHGTFFRYIYLLFHHCTTISGDHNGSTIGFPDCYFVEPIVLGVLLLATLVCYVKARIQTNWIFVAFVVAIPGLMVLAGRYARYYHYLFCIPAGVVICWALGALNRKWIQLPIIACMGIFFVYIQVDWFYKTAKVNQPYRAQQAEFVAFMKRNSSEFKAKDDLVSMANWFYYPTIQIGMRPWIKDINGLRGCLHSTEGRMDGLLNEKIKDADLRQCLANLMARFERVHPKLPKDGFLFSHDVKILPKAIEVFKELGYSIEIVDQDGDFTLHKFSR